MAVNNTKGAMTAAQLEDIIAKYKEQNPTKYEVKKEALEAKLKALKGDTKKAAK